ncbi:hypothetical protein ACQ4PT_049835 [Festuca glaucescens]
MGNAIEVVFTEAWHGLCTFHIMQNAVKHLPPPKKDETNVLSDFSACMYGYVDEETFEEVFHVMRSKVDSQTWLDSIYKVKQKWANCYMRNVYTLGMRSTQLSESLNSDLKKHLKSDLDILRFFKHLERAIQGKRDNELNSEYESRKKLPRLKVRTPKLLQASKVYTPNIFESFQNEYERSMSAYIKAVEHNEYIVAIGSLDSESTFEEECRVVGNYSEQLVTCSYGQFERAGKLCSHALKVLDVMNIKSLPERYILKRWTREVRSVSIEDRRGNFVLEDPRSEHRQRLKFLIKKIIGIASRAVKSEESSTLFDNALDDFSKRVDEKAPSCMSNVEATIEQPDVQLQSACLKKKEPQKKSSRRKRTWLEKQRPRKKKKESSKEVPQEEFGSRDGEEMAPLQDPIPLMPTSRTNENGFEEYGCIPSYTQLLLGSSTGQNIPDDTWNFGNNTYFTGWPN